MSGTVLRGCERYKVWNNGVVGSVWLKAWPPFIDLQLQIQPSFKQCGARKRLGPFASRAKVISTTRLSMHRSPAIPGRRRRRVGKEKEEEGR